MYLYEIVKAFCSPKNNSRKEELPSDLTPMNLLNNLKEITFFFLENSSFKVDSKETFVKIIKNFLMFHFYPLYISTMQCTNINFVLILEDYSEFLKERVTAPENLTEYNWKYTNLIDQTYISQFLRQTDWEKYIIKDNDDSDS